MFGGIVFANSLADTNPVEPLLIWSPTGQKNLAVIYNKVAILTCGRKAGFQGILVYKWMILFCVLWSAMQASHLSYSCALVGCPNFLCSSLFGSIISVRKVFSLPNKHFIHLSILVKQSWINKERKDVQGRPFCFSLLSSTNLNT